MWVTNKLDLEKISDFSQVMQVPNLQLGIEPKAA